MLRRLVVSTPSLVRSSQLGFFSRGYADQAAENNLQFSLTCPHEYVLNDTTVDSVTIPAIAGEMSVLSGTVPTITELNAGVVSVKALDGNVSRYFVSPGFALKSKDNVLTVSVAEAFPVEDLDPEAVSQGLQFWAQKRDAAPTPEEKEKAAVGVLVHEAMQHAINPK